MNCLDALLTKGFLKANGVEGGVSHLYTSQTKIQPPHFEIRPASAANDNLTIYKA